MKTLFAVSYRAMATNTLAGGFVTPVIMPDMSVPDVGVPDTNVPRVNMSRVNVPQVSRVAHYDRSWGYILTLRWIVP